MDAAGALTIAREQRRRTLTDRQKAFVAAYTDSTADTFMNATRSAAKVSPNAKPELMDRYGYKLRHHPKVERAIAATLRQHGFDMNERLKHLAEIGTGVARTEKQVVTQSGLVVDIEVWPSIRDRLQAIDLANKVDGIYSMEDWPPNDYCYTESELNRKIIGQQSGSR